MSISCWPGRSVAVSGDGQDAGAQRLHGFSLGVIEGAGMKRIAQGQELPAFGRRTFVPGACQLSPVNVPLAFGKDAPCVFGNDVPPIFGRMHHCLAAEMPFL